MIVDNESVAVGNILVDDDEVAIRELEEKFLRSVGYVVYYAGSENQALTILENNHIVLILSDVIMPEKDGFELAHIVHHKYPKVKIQLCSGFSDYKGKSVTDNNLLVKSFTQKELLERVDNLLKKI